MGSITLFYQAVSPSLIDLLRKLMKEELLKPFFLVGGTSLALRFGHRLSSDIDLFSSKAFDVAPLAELLSESYAATSLETATNTVRCVVAGIKLDLISHRYPVIEEPTCVDQLRLASLKDIAAMKLNAIANRGSKKDFMDYAELLKHFSRDEMFSFYIEKYTNNNLWYVEKSLSYFEDADIEPTPRTLIGQSWESVKKTILASNSI